jgi:type IV secretion system protein VirB2
LAVYTLANAQILGNTTTVLSELRDALRGIGIVVVTIAVMFVGFRMVFQAAQWKDVAPVFWGGVLIGGAAGIASSVLS